MAGNHKGKVQLALGRVVVYVGIWLNSKAPEQRQGIRRGGLHSMRFKKKGGKGTWIDKKVA